MVFVSFPENQPSLAAPDQMFCREGGLIGCAQTWAWISGPNCLMPLHLKKGEVSNDMMWLCTSQQPWKFRNSKKTVVIIVWHQPDSRGILKGKSLQIYHTFKHCLIPPMKVGPIFWPLKKIESAQGIENLWYAPDEFFCASFLITLIISIHF